MTRRQAFKIIFSPHRKRRKSTRDKAAAKVFPGPGQYDKEGLVIGRNDELLSLAQREAIA